MRPVEIIRIDSWRGLRTFLRFPWRIYAGDPAWVPPLLADQQQQFSAKNPFFRQAEVVAFLARRQGVPVGRIAAIWNRTHCETHGEPVGFFGFFECVEDGDVAGALLHVARDWLRGRGLRRVRGPVNFSTNDECGLLVEGYGRPPVLMMPYNPPYYAGLLEGAGLTRVKDLFAYLVEIPAGLPERVLHGAAAAEGRGARIRPVEMRRFGEELEVIRSIYNEAWSQNWGFVPLTAEEMAFTGRRLRQLVVPELALIADLGGGPAAFMLVLPDYNQALKDLDGRLFPLGWLRFLVARRRIDGGRLMVFGTRAAHRRKGLDALLYREALRGLNRLRYSWCEISWVLEDNLLIDAAVSRWGGRRYKTYRIYEGDC